MAKSNNRPKLSSDQANKALQELASASGKSVFASRRAISKLNPELAGLQAEVLMDTGRLDALAELKQKDADRLVNTVAKEEADVQKGLQLTYNEGLQEVQSAYESYTRDLQSLYYRSTQEKDSIYGKNNKPIEEEYLPALDTIIAAIKSDKLLSVRNGELRKPLLNYASKIQIELGKRTTLTNKLKQSAVGLLKSDVAMGVLVGAATKNPILALAAFALKQRQKRNDYKRKADATRRELRMKTAQAERGQSVQNKMQSRQLAAQEKAAQEEEAARKKQEDIEKRKAAGIARSKAKRGAKGGDTAAGTSADSPDSPTAGTLTSSSTATPIADSEVLTGVTAPPPESPIIFDAFGRPYQRNEQTASKLDTSTAPTGGTSKGTGQLGLPFDTEATGEGGKSILNILEQHTELLQKIYDVNEKLLKFQKDLEAKRLSEAESAEDESTTPSATQLKLPFGEEKKEDEGGGLLSTALSLLPMLRGGSLIKGLGGAVLKRLPGGKFLGGLAGRAVGSKLGTRLAGLAGKVGLGAAATATAASVASAGTGAAATATAKTLGAEAAEVGAKKLGKEVAEAGAKKGLGAAVKALIKKKVGGTIGKMAAKGIPGAGILVGGLFAANRLLQGDIVGAGLELGSSVGGLLTSIPLTIISLARDVYTESFGTPPEADPESGPRLEEVKTNVGEVVDEELEKLGLKEKKKEDDASKRGANELQQLQNTTQQAGAAAPAPSPSASEAPAAPSATPAAPVSSGAGSAPSGGAPGGGAAAPSPTPPEPPAPPPQPQQGFWSRMGKNLLQATAVAMPGAGLAYFAYQKAKELLSDNETAKVQDTELPEQPPPNVTIGPKTDLSKVDKKLLKRFYGFAKEFKRPVTINSGYRSDEYQAQIWVRGNIFHEPGIYTPAKPKNTTTITYKGQTFTVPGSGKGSPHGRGAALDVSVPGMGAMTGPVDSLFKKYGLKRPFLPKDPPHVQLAEGGGGGTDGDTATPADVKKDIKDAAQTAQPATPFGGGRSGGGGGGADFGPTAPATPAPSGGAPAAPTAPSAAATTATPSPTAPTAAPTTATPMADAGSAGRAAVTQNITAPASPMMPGTNNTTVVQGGDTMLGGGGGGGGAQQPILAPIDKEPTIRRILDGTLH